MYAQLGDIRFQGLVGWDSFSRRMEANYAEHALIDGKPRLQKLGDGLDSIRFDIQFHASFCNPRAELDNLIRAKVNGDVLPLIDGRGYPFGDFVITSIDELPGHTLPDGTYVLARASVELLEHVEPVAQSASGFAATAQRIIQAASYQGGRAVLMRTSVDATATVTTAGSHIGDAAKGKPGAVQRAKSALLKARDALTRTQKALDEAKEAQNTVQRVTNDINRTKQAVENASAALAEGDVDGAIVANREMQEGVSAMNGGLSEPSVLLAIRR